jgi:hypothetical protein
MPPSNTPTKMPGKLEADANQNAKHFGRARQPKRQSNGQRTGGGVAKHFPAGAATLLYPQSRRLWLHGWREIADFRLPAKKP